MEPLPEASDEDLFAAYCAGDTAAFETLFRRYQEPLRRHLERMLGDPAAAEVLVLETFLRLHRHRRRFRPGTTVRPWIYTIARNLARNRRRAQRLWGWLPLTTADEGTTPAPTSDTALQRRVTAAFAALSPAQREVCSLRLVSELPLEEIARVTGTSLGTVKSRLFYGLRTLRRRLADVAPDAP